jgi:hypothetical protein
MMWKEVEEKIAAGSDRSVCLLEALIMTRKFVSTLLRAAGMTVVPVAMFAVSVPVSAQRAGQRTLFEWRGNVDQEVRVQMQGGRTAVVGLGPREAIGYDNARALSSVPSTNGYVSVQMMEGRGNADVVQQPSAQNGYTTVVRIRDSQSGAGQYDIAAYWQPNGNYAYGNQGAYSGVYNDGQYNNDPYYNNGRYNNGRYYPDGRYNPSPPVVVVQRPVYVNQGVGKTLPVPQRSSGYPTSHAHPRYPTTGASHGYPSNGYPSANVQKGKTLPHATQARPVVAPPAKRAAPVVHPAPSAQSGKTLPGTVRPVPQGQAHGRGH